jgi:hypothetical protein
MNDFAGALPSPLLPLPGGLVLSHRWRLAAADAVLMVALVPAALRRC